MCARYRAGYRAPRRRVYPLNLPLAPSFPPSRAIVTACASRCRTRAGNYSGRGSGSRSGGGTGCARTRQNQRNARANSSRGAIGATRPTSGGPISGAPTSGNALSIYERARRGPRPRARFLLVRLARSAGRRAPKRERLGARRGERFPLESPTRVKGTAASAEPARSPGRKGRR